MCKASIDDPNAPDADTGDTIKVGANKYGMGTANRSKVGPSDGKAATAEAAAGETCLVCLHTGAELQVTMMTPELTKLLGDSVTLVFIETPGSHIEVIHDLVFVKEHPQLGQIPFATFAGCTAEVTKVTDDHELTAEEAIDAAATTIYADTGVDPVEELKAMIAALDADAASEEHSVETV
jgi:hypothetical protein